MSNKCRQGGANEHQMRSKYERPNPWSLSNMMETLGGKICLDDEDLWTEGVLR